jgi:nucleoid-associated protein YgaU
MASRYDDARPFDNKEEIYEEFFEDRDVNYIRQFRTGVLTHPTVADRAGLERIDHIWKLGDRLSKLAHQYYGDSTKWWVIAWYNGRPTEAHFKIGTRIRIPTPLNRVLSILKRY